jgi:hypothetical protein
MTMSYSQVAGGLNILMTDTRQYADAMHLKVGLMQEVYLQRNLNIYSETEVKQVREYLKAALYKFYLSTLSLEQLWSMSHTKRDDIVVALQNSLDNLDCTDDELLIISFVFEGFLFLSRSFLDFYMLYLCLALKTGYEGSISQEKFYKSLERSKDSVLSVKAEKVGEYFRTKVFAETATYGLAPENWGTLIRTLRDKIAHRDVIKQNFAGNEKLLDKVLFNWPTLRGTTYDRFCQSMQNGMFFMLTDISSLLYDLEWKAGSYRPDLYNA